MDWKSSNITPIFKKGSKHSPANYQTISLTSIAVKVLECLIHQRITTDSLLQTITIPERLLTQRTTLANLNSLNRSISGVRLSTSGHQHTLSFWISPELWLCSPPEIVPKHRYPWSLTRWIEAFLCGRWQRVVVEGHHSTLHGLQ